MEPERPKPIYSTLADEPELSEDIDAFVVGLAERIDALQDAERLGEIARLAELAHALAARARALGYEPIAQCAAGVESAALDGKPREAHDGLVALTEIAQRVRLGHRGAV